MKTLLSLCSLFVFSLAAFAEGDTASWIAVLGSADATQEEKARACQRLGEFGGEAAIPALAALLPDPVLNTYARAGLERIPGEIARSALREALAYCDGAPLIGVIESLGALGVAEAAEDLDKLVRHKDAEVADAALRSLGRTGDGAAALVSPFLADPSAEVRASAATACLLAADDRRLAGDIEAERKIYEAMLAAKIPRQQRLAAVRGAILAKQSVPFLMEQLRSEDRAVQDVAFLALRSFSGPDLAEALQAELRSAEEAQRQIRLVHALRDCSGPGTVSTLIDRLADAEDDLRVALIRALGRLDGVEAAAALLDIVEEEEAALVLAQMKGEGIDERILNRLKGASDSAARLKCIGLLGDRRSRVAAETLLALAGDDDPEIAKGALRALRPLAGLPQIPVLVALYKTSGPETQSQALLAVVSACRQSDPLEPAGDLILAELESADEPESRQTWLSVLAAIGHGPALPVLARELGSGDPETVAATIDLLGRWPDSAPVDALIAVARKPDFRPAALRAILTLIGRSKDNSERFAWLREVQPLVSSRAEKQQFLLHLGSTFEEGSLELLAPYLKDEEVREEALEARKSLNRSLK